VQSTGATGGPRSPGAPSCNAGPDQFIEPGATAHLAGSATTTGATPMVAWKKYSGPGTVAFGNTAQTNTTATFSLPGRYTLMLSADDTVHTVAYDAVIIDVRYPVDLVRSGNDVMVRFPSTSGQKYRVECTADLAANSWTTLADNIAGTGSLLQIPHTGVVPLGSRFYRVVFLP
jgi:hypothetical protein